MAKELRDAKTLLAEMYAEGSDAKLAVGVYKELVDDILADPATKSLDDTTLRVFNGAVQAYLQLNDMPSASAVATKLLDLGADEIPVNMALINFAKRLEVARKQAASEVDSTGNPAAGQQGLVDMEIKVMTNLAKRENLAPKPRLPITMAWLVKILSQLDNDDADAAATQLIDKILDKANNDNEFDKQIGKYKAYLHSLAATIQAKPATTRRPMKPSPSWQGTTRKCSLRKCRRHRFSRSGRLKTLRSTPMP